MKDKKLELVLGALILKAGMNPVMQGSCYVMHPEALQAVIDEAIKQSLAAPVQTVVKWNPLNGVVQCHNCGQNYTTAQRTWVELTDEDKCKPDMGEWVELNEDWLDGYQAGMEFANKKLKEKNT